MTAPTKPDPSTYPRRSTLDHGTGMRLARTEYEQFADVLDRLENVDWHRRTACEEWDVRAVAGHCLGQLQACASPLEARRQVSAAKQAGGEFLDAFTAHQVLKNAGLSAADLIAAYRRLIPAGVRGRRLLPAPLRRLGMGQQQVVGTTVEPWTLGFLFDVIFTRDTWMHRIDICRAVGAEPMVREEHDGIIVANVVEEWAGRHGQAFDLILTGPAGGRWERGGAEPMTLDAVEFCWLLSGRGEGEGLLATEVPF